MTPDERASLARKPTSSTLKMNDKAYTTGSSEDEKTTRCKGPSALSGTQRSGNQLQLPPGPAARLLNPQTQVDRPLHRRRDRREAENSIPPPQKPNRSQDAGPESDCFSLPPKLCFGPCSHLPCALSVCPCGFLSKKQRFPGGLTWAGF